MNIIHKKFNIFCLINFNIIITAMNNSNFKISIDIIYNTLHGIRYSNNIVYVDIMIIDYYQ